MIELTKNISRLTESKPEKSDKEIIANSGFTEQSNYVFMSEDQRRFMWWDKRIDDRQMILNKLNERVIKFKEQMQKFWNENRSSKFLFSQNSKYEDDYRSFIRRNFQSDAFKNLSFNISQIAIDSHYNSLVKQKPRVTFQTKDASSIIKRLAEKADNYVYNAFKKGNFFNIINPSIKTAMISGIKHIKPIPDLMNKSFDFVQVRPENFLVEEPYEASEMREEFFEKKKLSLWQIEESLDMMTDEQGKEDFKKHFKDCNRDEVLEVYEAYKTNGKKVVFCKDMIFFITKWKYDFIPYIPVRWDNSEEGYIGRSIISITQDCQMTLNWLIYIILENAETYQNNMLLVPQGSNYGEMVSNEMGLILPYNSDLGKPFQLNPNIINKQYFLFADNVFNMGLRKARVSEAQQQAAIPKNIKGSGKAIEAYSIMDTGRFTANTDYIYSIFMDCATITLKWAIELYKKEKDYMWLNDIRENKKDFFKDVQKYPESIIDSSPQQKYDMANQLFSAGQLSLEQFLTIIDKRSEEIPNVATSRTNVRAATARRIDEALKAKRGISFDNYLGIEIQEDVALKKYDEIIAEDPQGENSYKIGLLVKYLDAINTEKEKRIAAQEAEIQRLNAMNEAKSQLMAAPKKQTA